MPTGGDGSVSEALNHHLDGVRVDVYTDPPSAQCIGSGHGGAAPTKWVQHQITGIGRCPDDAL